MRKYFYFLSFLIAVTLFGDNRTNVKIVVVPMGELNKAMAGELETDINKSLSVSGNYNIVKDISPKVLGEIKTELFNGKSFEGIENISADAVVFIKLFKSGENKFLEIKFVNTETGEFIIDQLPFNKKEYIGETVTRILDKQYKPLTPLTNVDIKGNNYWIKVIAKGKGPNKGSIGKKISLMDAKRRAVEKAIGSVVSVKFMPNEEKQKLVSKTKGTLKYKIVSQKVNGKFSETIISAEVLLPEDAVKKYPAVYFPKPIATGHEALTQKMKSVIIDWEKGELIAKGTGKIEKKNNGELFARRAAIANAQGEALKSMKGVRIKRDKKLSDYGMEYQLEGLVKGGEIVAEGKKGDSYWVDLKVPLYGVSSLTALLIDESAGGPFAGEVKEQEIVEEVDGFTGIVIDATGLGVQPAITTEIYGEDGEPMYNLNIADSKSVKELGMASYVVEFDEGAMLENLKHASLFPLLASNSDFYWLARNKRRHKSRSYTKKRKYSRRHWRHRRRRQGRRPMRYRAVSLPKGGKITTGAVISSKGKSKKLRRAARKLFRTARVVIITDPMVGGTEGKLITPVWVGGLW